MANCNLPLPCESSVKFGSGAALSIVNNGGGKGISGESHSFLNISNSGVEGYSDTASGVFGSSDKGGNGVVGLAENGGDGVHGESYNGGSAISGYSESRSGYGIYGENAYTTGVLGYSENVGVGGVCEGESGAAVGAYDQSREGMAIYAHSKTGTGIYVQSGGALCAHFDGGDVQIDNGDLRADGDLSVARDLWVGGHLTVEDTAEFHQGVYAPLIAAALKLFRIDHPLDPANRYLSHASVESSERKNFYDGIAELDEKGTVTIILPNWFEALNTEFRYQLTSLGAAAPELHISQEISRGQFVISGGRSGLRVSWQVTGIRHDAIARYQPMIIESDKAPSERGYYQNPEAHGKGREAGIAYLRGSDSRQPTIRPGSERTKPPIPARPVRPEIQRRSARKTGPA